MRYNSSMIWFSLLPVWYQFALVASFGLIIGSFLNVFIYRFHTGRSLSGSSHCLSCGVPLRWYELLPVLSYVALRGRCRSCGSYIPVRYALVELLTAALFLWVFVTQYTLYSVLMWWVIAAVLVVILVYDLYHLIIPDALVAALTVAAVGLFLGTVPAALYGAIGIPAVLSALGAFAFFGGMWYISSGRWVGFGDAKLAIPLAFMVGPMGTFTFIVFAFWIGAVVSLLIMGGMYLWVRGKGRLPKHSAAITMKSEVPFAPFMIAAFLLTALLQLDVLVLTARVLTNL